MESISDLITLGLQNEHDLEHDLVDKPLFSTPKIYDADGDLNKRWYIYYSYRNPKTGKLKRMKNIYGKVNRYKTKESRYFLLALYKRRLLLFLRAGYDPFLDNTELYEQHVNGTTPHTTPNTTPSIPGAPQQDPLGGHQKPVHSAYHAEYTTGKPQTPEQAQEPCAMGVEAAMEYGLSLKANLVSNRTMVDYKNRCGLFFKWLDEHHKEISTINQLSKKNVSEFLNHIQLKTSARNRNNYRTCLGTVFQTLEDNEIIEKNFIKNISTLKTKPERNRAYTKQQEEAIFSYLEEKDPILLLFIKFISYNFLRPIEVCRLRIRDINLQEKVLQIKVKNKPLKTKLIPEILLKELSNISHLDGDLLLFTPQSIGGDWEAELTNRRDHFSKRFRTVVKEHYGFDGNYGLHSFRHTFITKLYRNMVKESSPYAAKSSLMQITGHSTMKALEMYLRDIDAELPNDYSNLLN